MNWVLPPPEPVGVPVRGGGRFPVRYIWCAGRNYAEHAREMGADVVGESPLFFSKPAHALVTAGTVTYPPLTRELHHEVELVVALKTGGAGLDRRQARQAILGYAVGVDLTRRDVQAEAKRRGHPWDMAKGFDQSAVIGTIQPVTAGFPANRGVIELAVNGETRQRADLADMIWPVEALLVALSTQVRLAPGDLLFTGTPAGVGSLQPGDQVRAAIQGLPPLEFSVEAPAA